MNPEQSVTFLPVNTEIIVGSALLNNAFAIINQECAITANQHRDLQNIFYLIKSEALVYGDEVAIPEELTR